MYSFTFLNIYHVYIFIHTLESEYIFNISFYIFFYKFIYLPVAVLSWDDGSWKTLRWKPWMSGADKLHFEIMHCTFSGEFAGFGEASTASVLSRGGHRGGIEDSVHHNLSSFLYTSGTWMAWLSWFNVSENVDIALCILCFHFVIAEPRFLVSLWLLY